MSVEIYKAIGFGLMAIAGLLFSSGDAFTKGAGAGFFFGVLAGALLVGHVALQTRKKRDQIIKETVERSVAARLKSK